MTSILNRVRARQWPPAAGRAFPVGTSTGGGNPVVAFPFPGAAVDLDFINQQYVWAGVWRSTSDFTTFTLNGSTFDQYGLTPSATIDITLDLTGIWELPGAIACRVRTPAANPGTNRVICQIDDGTANERVSCLHNATGSISLLVTDGGSTTANVSGGIAANSTIQGFAGSFQTDEVLASRNGVAGTADVSASMPTVTTLRIGKATAASTEFTGPISRVTLFDAVQAQAIVNANSSVMQTWAGP